MRYRFGEKIGSGGFGVVKQAAVIKADESLGRSDLAAKFLQDHFTATAALIALMLKDLPEFVRTRTFDAVRNGTGKLELRIRPRTRKPAPGSSGRFGFLTKTWNTRTSSRLSAET